ncbi:MAG: SDR family oxidoreductase [Elusimicrobia bacterium]|nr:SDR family oxidoreductase [Elusimicrobiota bacterium]
MARGDRYEPLGTLLLSPGGGPAHEPGEKRFHPEHFSILGVRGAVGCANYAAAKAGLLGLTKAAALELGRFNIRVNAILPGFHPTEMSDKIPPAQKDRVMAQHALGRSTDLDELTRFVLNLAETTTVSGQVFNVDSRGL